MILAGLVAPAIIFDEHEFWDLTEEERDTLNRWSAVRPRSPEIVPYLEIIEERGPLVRRFIVQPVVPCVTLLP